MYVYIGIYRGANEKVPYIVYVCGYETAGCPGVAALVCSPIRCFDILSRLDSTSRGLPLRPPL